MIEPFAHSHVLLTDLADFIDGRLRDNDRARVEAHLGTCRDCRIAIRRAMPSLPIPEATMPDDIAYVESKIREALQSEAPELSAGQLWRLRWADTTALAVVLRIEGEDVTVAPVGLDEWMADDYAIVVPTSWSPLDIGFAVWVGLEAVVPLFVLDVCLGEVDVLDQIAAVGPAYRKGVPVGEAIVVGSPILDSADERSQYRHQLSLAFGSLSEAMWLDVTDGSGGHEADSLADVLEGVDPRELAQALGLDAPSTFALMSGERLLTPEEADVIAQVVGVDASEVLAAIPPLPPGLVHELSHPYHRVAIEERARVAGHSESEERRLALGDLLPVAARRAGDEAAPLDWRRLVRDRFDG